MYNLSNPTLHFLVYCIKKRTISLNLVVYSILTVSSKMKSMVCLVVGMVAVCLVEVYGAPGKAVPVTLESKCEDRCIGAKCCVSIFKKFNDRISNHPQIIHFYGNLLLTKRNFIEEKCIFRENI